MNNRANYRGYVASIVSLTAALFMLGVVSYAMLSAKGSMSSLSGDVTMTVMLTDSLSESDRAHVKQIIESRREVSSYKYVDKEQAADDFSTYIGHDVSAVLGQNPLPNIYSLSIGADFATKSDLERLRHSFDGVRCVGSVVYEQQIAEQLTSNFDRLQMLMLGFAAILVFVALILIYNTIRLMVGSSAGEIRAMQLVGAKYGFICAPFIRRAVVGGSVAGIFASAALWFGIQVTMDALPMLSLTLDYLPLIAAAEVVAGVALSTLFTYISLNQQLRR